MSLFPQLDTLFGAWGQEVVLRKVQHTVSDYGSPVEATEDWRVSGLVGALSGEDEQYFQGLMKSGSMKCYIRSRALAINPALGQRPVEDLGINSHDKIVHNGVVYSIKAVRDYTFSCGFYALLLESVEVGG